MFRLLSASASEYNSVSVRINVNEASIVGMNCKILSQSILFTACNVNFKQHTVSLISVAFDS